MGMNGVIMALDPGTTTGWCVLVDGSGGLTLYVGQCPGQVRSIVELFEDVESGKYGLFDYGSLVYEGFVLHEGSPPGGTAKTGLSPVFVAGVV